MPHPDPRWRTAKSGGAIRLGQRQGVWRAAICPACGRAGFHSRVGGKPCPNADEGARGPQGGPGGQTGPPPPPGGDPPPGAQGGQVEAH